MFSGIVECCCSVRNLKPGEGALRLELERPSQFNDLAVGQSICVDGACLTIEKFDQNTMNFTLAAESLQVLGWSLENPPGPRVNVERSLRFGDRVHGHLVTGHVEGKGRVTATSREGESLHLEVELPENLMPWIWQKGCVAINGVSLTVNEVDGVKIRVCLIPETLRTTNLIDLELGSQVNVETDYLAKALVRSRAGEERQ